MMPLNHHEPFQTRSASPLPSLLRMVGETIIWHILSSEECINHHSPIFNKMNALPKILVFHHRTEVLQ